VKLPAPRSSQIDVKVVAGKSLIYLTKRNEFSAATILFAPFNLLRPSNVVFHIEF
jgi:hypothetical protein